jgi:DNA-directed RNA polymerase subunit L
MEVYVRYKDGSTQTIKRVSSWNYSKELNAYVFKVENDTYTYHEKNRTVIIGREQVELVSIRED